MALCVVAVLLLRLGVSNFNRESILAKDSRPPNRRALLQVLVTRRPDLTLPALRASFQRARGAIVAASFLLVVGVVFGALAQAFNLVPQAPVTAAVHQEAAVGHEVVVNSPHLFSFIFIHNLLVGLVMGMLAPVTLGVAGGLLTLLNGFVVGYVGGTFAAWSHFGFFACGVLPHGVFELPALVLSSAFALRLGASVVRPSPQGWLAGVGLALGDYLRGMLVVVPLFAMAAAVEAYVTPAVLTHC
jgi:stage II sporulation protein M